MTLSFNNNQQRELSPRRVQARKLLYECCSKCSTTLNLDYTKQNKEYLRLTRQDLKGRENWD